MTEAEGEEEPFRRIRKSKRMQRQG